MSWNASSGKRNVTVWRPSVCPIFVSNLNKARGAYSTWLTRGQHAACDSVSVHFGPTFSSFLCVYRLICGDLICCQDSMKPISAVSDAIDTWRAAKWIERILAALANETRSWRTIKRLDNGDPDTASWSRNIKVSSRPKAIDRNGSKSPADEEVSWQCW